MDGVKCLYLSAFKPGKKTPLHLYILPKPPQNQQALACRKMRPFD